MSATTVIFLIVPVVWVALIWAGNFYAVRHMSRRSTSAWFAFSATSPILVISLYLAGWGVAHGRPAAVFHDLKVPLILLQIGLPASLVATVFAWLGSRRWTA
jgi:hypothetical protein